MTFLRFYRTEVLHSKQHDKQIKQYMQINRQFTLSLLILLYAGIKIDQIYVIISSRSSIVHIWVNLLNNSSCQFDICSQTNSFMRDVQVKPD